MALGAGGENMAGLPGVSFRDLKSSAGSGLADWRMARGLSILKRSGGTTQLPAVQVEGYCDGSVKPGTGTNFLLGDGSVRFVRGAFHATLTPAADSTNTPLVWGGPLTLSIADGTSLQGILIGLFQPKRFTPGSGAGTTVPPPIPMKCLFITPGGNGVFDGVSGIGTGYIDFGASYEDTVNSTVAIKPWSFAR